MLIIGDLSGIQDFVFAVPEEQGGQARMLRARSFFVQVLAEALVLRIQRAVGLDRNTLLFCAAGKFAVYADATPAGAATRLKHERAEIEAWLACETSGALKLALAIDTDDGGDPEAVYQRAMSALQHEKLRPWGAYAVEATWMPERLVLAPPDAQRAAAIFREIGRVLPHAVAVDIEAADDRASSPQADQVSFMLPGFRAILRTQEDAGPSGATLLRGKLGGGDVSSFSTDVPEMRRPLARHVPTQPDGTPVWFEDLARRARGAPYLGVLKMDADSLGSAIHGRLRSTRSMATLARFSEELEGFFAVELEQLLKSSQWQAAYTIFSGGDDLLLVGPWNHMLDLAGEIRERFHRLFGGTGVTISGGCAVIRQRFPVRRAAAQVEDLLELAKGEPAPGSLMPKNQLAALGQVWKWEHHATILDAGKRLADWVDAGVARRGWLQVLLALTRRRREQLRGSASGEGVAATSQLAYHVARNYPTARDPDPERRALRQWADSIVARFDQFDPFIGPADPEVIYLPTILRYALLATRHIWEDSHEPKL